MDFNFQAILSTHTCNVTYVVMKNVPANGSCVFAICVIVFDAFVFGGEQSCNSKLTCQAFRMGNEILLNTVSST